MSRGDNATSHYDVFLGSERYGGNLRCGTEGVGGVKNAWYYLPWWSIVPIRVRSRVAVCSKHRHGALSLSSSARGFVTVARATRFDRAIAGGRVKLDSTVARAAFAGLFDVIGKPKGGVSSVKHGPDLGAQLDGVANDVSRKWGWSLEREIKGKSQKGLRAVDVLQGGMGRG